jgi:hypothetical protein
VSPGGNTAHLSRVRVGTVWSVGVRKPPAAKRGS